MDISEDSEQVCITEEEKSEWLAMDDGGTEVPDMTDAEIVAEFQRM